MTRVQDAVGGAYRIEQEHGGGVMSRVSFGADGRDHSPAEPEAWFLAGRR